jgi:hypothetical protein
MYLYATVCDDKRQRHLLREVVVRAKLSDCEVLSYAEFEERLLPPQIAAIPSI